ncbi:hypothetical protein RvY_00257-4 [Ramazzottius varieornatus]|uniref:Uncharacterized protein n=1 Tax=Ramazzottius varieornatus TaxID=947166 RepID=A0A1D1UD47_RAMVA|nr:hypothetical protein RvY_00257-4 [Ramazzottius varieornatus]
MDDPLEGYSSELFVQNVIGCKSFTVYHVLACTALFFFHDGLLRLFWRRKAASKRQYVRLPNIYLLIVSVSSMKPSKFYISRFVSSVFLLLDFFVIILPTLLIVTLLSDWMAYLLRFLMMSSVVLMLKCAVASGDREGGTIGAPDDEKGHSQEYIVVTEFRGCVLLLVCIAILAVDFDLFPYEMVKTDRQGYSLMDLGVGHTKVPGN